MAFNKSFLGSTFNSCSQTVESGLGERMSKNDIVSSVQRCCTLIHFQSSMVRQMQLATASFVFHKNAINFMVLAAWREWDVREVRRAQKCGFAIFHTSSHISNEEQFILPYKAKCSYFANCFIQANVQIPDLEMLAVPSLGNPSLSTPGRQGVGVIHLFCRPVWPWSTTNIFSL